MSEIIKMPRLSDTMKTGVVSKWYKKVGDFIKEGELISDIETDISITSEPISLDLLLKIIIFSPPGYSLEIQLTPCGSAN